MRKSLLLRILTFWEENPALFYGLALFLGCLFALKTAWALLPLCFLAANKKIFGALVVFLIPCCFIQHLYTFPPSHSHVEGIFYIQSIKKSDKFSSGFTYLGILKTSEGRIYCKTFSKVYQSPSVAYKVSGLVRSSQGKYYSLKIQSPWQKCFKRFTLANLRLRAHEVVKGYIKKNIPQKRASEFLIGMVTSEMDEPVLHQELKNLGLNHLMSVSGLHFSLLALICHLFFRLVLPFKIEALVLIVLLSLYLLFIGNTPSILRAWTSAMVFLLGQLLEKRSFCLNSLGVALIISLMVDPLSANTLGFQLSFLATGGILLLFSPLDRLLKLWIPKVPLSIAATKHGFWQHGYIFVSLFREALCLTLAVHLALLPLTLKTFHFISINSLVYNLFFPFLASLALLFFIISIPLGHIAHLINGAYCEWILNICHSPPLLFTTFWIKEPPSWLLALFFTLLLATAAAFRNRKDDREMIV